MKVLARRPARVEAVRACYADGRAIERKIEVQITVSGIDGGSMTGSTTLLFLIPASEASSWIQCLGKPVTLALLDAREDS